MYNKDRKGGGLKIEVRFAGIDGIYTDGLAEDDWPAAYEAMRYLPTSQRSRIIVAQMLRFSYCFQGQFCKWPLLRVIFNRNLGDYYAIRSTSACV
jgi:hypothetical protein|eukprot:COSAG06_NODE_1828_length_8275_cov_2.284002_3_plen_95_part_00